MFERFALAGFVFGDARIDARAQGGDGVPAGQGDGGLVLCLHDEGGRRRSGRHDLWCRGAQGAAFGRQQPGGGLDDAEGADERLDRGYAVEDFAAFLATEAPAFCEGGGGADEDDDVGA